MIESAVTYHEASGRLLTCDECGCVVDASERDRNLHQEWHRRSAEVIDLTVKHETVLARVS